MKVPFRFVGVTAAGLLCFGVSFSGTARTPTTLEIDLVDGTEVQISWTHPNAVVEETEHLSFADWRVIETDPVQGNGRFILMLMALEQQDQRKIELAYDANGNLTTLTPPGHPAHTFTYNAANLFTSYTPPEVELPSHATSYTSYDKLGRIIEKTETIEGTTQTFAYSYDQTDRLVEARKNGLVQSS